MFTSTTVSFTTYKCAGLCPTWNKNISAGSTLVQKPECNFSYYRRHLSCLPQEVSKIISIRLSQKVGYDFTMADPVISGFIPNQDRI